MGETISAVIWLSDLRGFTSLSESPPRDELIELLNRYFGPMCDAVEANAAARSSNSSATPMLAIFPIEQEAAAACRRALRRRSGGDAIEAGKTINGTAPGQPANRLRSRVARRRCMYGNIGGDARLDFTVIGPAVNLTSRIESMCKDLERSPLLSAEFVRASGVRAELLGEFALKGVWSSAADLWRDGMTLARLQLIKTLPRFSGSI